MDFANYLADKLIDATVRNIPYDTPEKVWVALYTTDPTLNGQQEQLAGFGCY